MATVAVAGILRNPQGDPIKGARIDITQIRKGPASAAGSVASQTTDADGAYSFSLEPGVYQAVITYSGSRETTILGNMTVQDGGEAGSLESYTFFSDTDLTQPTFYATLKRFHDTAVTAGGETSTAVTEAKEAAVAAADKAAVAQEASQSVLGAKAEVEEVAAVAVTARDDAQNFATIAQSGIAITGKSIYPDIASGLAATPAGGYFQVPQGLDKEQAFITYRNNSGTAVAVANWPGKQALDKTIASNAETNNRTAGLRTSAYSKNPYEIITANGRAAAWLDATGIWHFPGGLSISALDLTRLVSDSISAPEVNVGRGSLKASAGKYLYAETDTAGRVVFGTLPDGSKEYMGYPLKNRQGLLRNDFFFIGDSITAFTQTTSGAYNDTNRNEAPTVCSQGWPVWAEMFSNGRIKFAGISATGGFRADQILATHVPVAVAAKPTFCVVLAGRNNVVQNYTFDSTISSMRRIYETLRKAGIVPVCCSMSAQTGNTAAQDTLRYAVNEWVRAYAEKNRLPFVDMHAATTDPTTGEWYSGWNYDASHPTGVGAKGMGRALVDSMTDWVANILPRMAVSNTNPATSTNLLDNPLFITSASGTEPDGWSVTSAGASSLATDAAVKGKAWRLQAVSNVNAQRYKTVAVVAGQRLGFGLFFRKNNNAASASRGDYAYVVSGDTAAGTAYLAGIRRWLTISDGFGYFWQEFVVPAGVTNVTVVLSGEDMTIAQIALFKITEI